MPAPAKETQEKGERETRTKYFQEFKGVYTKASRTAIPPDTFYDLQNLMPIGPANLHSVPGHLLTNMFFAGKSIYWMQYMCINSTDYLMACSTAGDLYAYNIVANTWSLVSSVLGGVQTRMDQWKNSTILIIDTTGYYSWDGTTFTTLTGGIIPSATLTNPEIAVFANFVWIYSNRVLYISGIDDYTGTAGTGGFLVANGATTQQLTDPQMRGQIVRMISASGYLYLMFKSSIFLISDAYIPASASPPAVTFSFINVTAQVGCTNPGSVFLMDRDLMFANTTGLWSLSGVDTTRISEDIDGTLQYLDQTFPISGGITNVNNIQQGVFLFKTVGDPVFGTRYTLACNFDNKWWFSSNGQFYYDNANTALNFTFITSAMSGNLPVIFAISNGNFLWQLFYPGWLSQPSSWQGPLWPMEDIVSRKGVLRAGFEVSSVTNGSNAASTFSLNVDTEGRSTPIPSISILAAVIWQNNVSSVVTWQNNGNQTVQWSGSGSNLYFGDGQGAFGRYVGFSGSAAAGTTYQIDTFMMDYQLWTRWT